MLLWEKTTGDSPDGAEDPKIEEDRAIRCDLEVQKHIRIDN